MWDIVGMITLFLVLPITLIGAVVSAIKRKPVWKKWLAGAGVAFIAMVVSAINAPAPNAPAPEKAVSPASTTQVATTAEQKVDQSAQQQGEQEVSQQKETADVDKEHIIPGLTSGDIKVNLERTWGFKFTGPQIRKTLAIDHGEAIDPDTGVELICDIYESSPMAIQWVEFMVDGSAVAGSLDSALFNAVAEGYLGYAATVPYDGADQEKARAWVKANIKAADKQGKVLTTVIGPVKFELYGTQWFRVLEVKPAQAE